MVTSRIALEGLLQQNRLSTNVCKDTLRMQGSATELFHLYAAGKRENDHHHHAVDETSSSSCGADTMTTAIKREAHTPTTDQSEDSGVDVSAAARGGGGDGHGGRPYKRRRPDDDDDDYDDDDGCRPTAAKSSRMADAAAAAAQAVLSVNVAACPPFRPWSSDESPSAADVGLRLFHDIRNVDRILTLTQRRREPTTPPPPPTPETQPLDLTNGRGRRDDADTATVGLADSTARTATVGPADSTARAATPPSPPSPPSPPPPPPSTDTCATTAVCGVAAATNTTAATTTAAATRYSKNMSRARRIEANARERSRVHTISAAFDTLRATIPSYSRNQKLSKLSTIRIASAYILTLSRLLDMDYSAAQDRPSVDECVDNVTGIIHMEGKARKKKDER